MGPKLRPTKQILLSFLARCAPRAPKSAPRAAKSAPRAPQERPRAPQDHHKSAQERTKTRLRRPKMPQNASKMLPRRPKTLPRWSQDAPAPKRFQKANLWNVFTTQISRTNATNTYRLGGAFLGSPPLSAGRDYVPRGKGAYTALFEAFFSSYISFDFSSILDLFCRLF